jgi:hypothetical protein
LSRSGAESGDRRAIANPALPTIIFSKAFIITVNAFLIWQIRRIRRIFRLAKELRMELRSQRDAKTKYTFVGSP